MSNLLFYLDTRQDNVVSDDGRIKDPIDPSVCEAPDLVAITTIMMILKRSPLSVSSDLFADYPDVFRFNLLLMSMWRLEWRHTHG